ncbi:MAG: hypothetical protein C7B44_04645 [Sulfobacillus thermosulfidooxidans]|uniref:Type II secretion system protein GspF domain-containing protein n=2 Tax=Sulfobacillus thermosulfidooxidans TaxID=28034 RepID=A0A1W1WPP5_SULTA|nr:hypothetical protein [Sulfobacillus thermosulfidooxidans]PSR37257.1 MAG: hypothetical protein C7B44_04645 [Sulfobacillus thermosulfidooxidans]SMC08179.1 hypothetical protein SAMN00768000_3718 [Sulfobacillus thermosulfidooxidans DSM 9293]
MKLNGSMPWIAAGGGVLLWLWSWRQLWVQPRPLTFTPEDTRWQRWQHALVRWTQNRWSRRVRDELAILGWSTGQTAFWVLFFAAFVGLPTDIVTHHRLFALMAALFGAWWGPQLWIHRNFLAWQQELLRDFVPLVLMLSVYFDLGYSPERAVEDALIAVGPPTEKELQRLLAAWHQQTGTPAAIVQQWAARLKLLPYQQLADTLSHHLERGISGAALKPLHTLISAQQQQGARALADRVDQQITVVPALVMLGIMLMVMFTFFAHGTGSTSGITVL